MIRFLTIAFVAITIFNQTFYLPTKADSLDRGSANLVDENNLDNLMDDFGKQISDLMTNEVEALVKEVHEVHTNKSKHVNKNNNNNNNNKPALNVEDLENFKNANKKLSKDTKEIIANAGKKNQGELTQSGLMGDADAGKGLLQQVAGKLHTAGTFIGHHLNVLSGFAPKLTGNLVKVPSQLKRLMHWPTFLKFKIKFNKVYKSVREELYRQMVFLKTQTIVGIQNLKFLCGRAKHLLKATQFADWTDKEYKKIFDNLHAESAQNSPEIQKMSQKQKETLTNLAKTGTTIFGKPAPEAGPTAPDRRLLNEDKLSRRKRDNSELDDDEDEDDLPSDSLFDQSTGNNNPVENQTGLNEEQSDHDGSSKILGDDSLSKVVEEFSAQFDENAGNIDEVEGMLDSVLNDDKEQDFEPIDLRKTGCIVEPENQGSCGACYAYVTMAAAAYHNCMLSDKKELVRYNTRFLSDCGRYISTPDESRPKVNGCHGGRVSHAIKFVDLAGAYEFMDYEFARRGMSSRDDSCAYSRPSSLNHWQPMENIPAISVPAYHGIYYANLQMDEIDLHLRTVGPVFVNVRVWDGFKNYASGIVDSFKEGTDTVIHSMLIVGHDKDPHGRDYYIIWNSHGTSWGEGGYTRIYADSLDYFKIYIGGLLPDTDNV